MIKYNIKSYLAIIVITFLVIYGGLALIQAAYAHIVDKPYNITWIKNISYALTAETLLSIAFVKWWWKWKYFSFFVPIPNISGTWDAVLKYKINGIEEEKKQEIIIKQDFFRTIIKLETNESESVSISAQFDIDRDRDIKRLFYTYENVPKPEYRNQSPIHYGAVRLNISDDNKKLDGEYWTSRKSVGTINLKRKHK